MSMRNNELRGIVVIGEILREFIAAHPDRDVFAHFEMQMRIVETMGRAHCADLLAASHRLAASNQNLVQMPVKRVNIANHAAFAVRVAHNYNVPPALMAVAREHNHAITNGADRVAEVGVTAAHSVPIFADMSLRSKAARFI